MRIVVALGGNALLERGERPDELVQRHHVVRAAQALAPLCPDHQLVICHGNGPQVGLLALESAADPELTQPYGLDTLVAQTQGMIGYWLAQELPRAGADREVAVLLTQTEVRADDPGFAHPTKFVGQVYPDRSAGGLAVRLGWTVAADGPGWRRVVASPEPLRIVEMPAVRALVESGAVVVCGGGGGVPVVVGADGTIHGVDAVVDKDLTAALIAESIGADLLLVLTAVPAVMQNFGRPDQRALRRLTTVEAAGLDLPDGSMGPKVEACRRFTEATGRPSAIGALDQVTAILAGDAGTTVVPAPGAGGL
jgi:carbamate kinase